jgi:hypothetical protein
MAEQVLDRRNNLVRAARGNWEAFDVPMNRVQEIVSEWADALKGVDKPWLCWNVSERWCLLQQRLVQEAGWTPVIGTDPRTGLPRALPGSIVIDFNKGFQFPVLHPIMVLEFVFLFADRFAFWHSDLLCRLEVMEYLASTFASLRDGELAAVPDKGGLRYLFNTRKHRYWELACCTTRGASRDQFEKGAGWWRHIAAHPNCTDPDERRRRRGVAYDHGGGIMYWKRRYGGKVIELDAKRIAEGQCTSINRPDYKRVSGANLRNLPQELDQNYDLEEVAGRLGLRHLV